MPAPELLAFQACSAGVKLSDVFGKVSLVEKLSITEELARVSASAEKTSRCGTLVAVSDGKLPPQASSRLSRKGPMLDTEVKDYHDNTESDLASVLERGLRRQLKVEIGFNPNSAVAVTFERLLSMLREMQTAVIFSFWDPAVPYFTMMHDLCCPCPNFLPSSK